LTTPTPEGARDSAVPRELIDAYLATDYRVGSRADSFILRIGEHSPALAALCERCGEQSAAFISACNPYSERQIAAVNAAAHARLCVELECRGMLFIEGAGVAPAGKWQEQSVLVLGVSLDTAKDLGRRFEQNAIVWIGPDAIPQLCLLR
jgi:hypothetical protein